MNDDQMVQLLRDVPLPAEPMDRYADVAGRRRRADGRRLTVVGASLAVVALVATVSVVTLRDPSTQQDIATVLSAAQTGTAHVEGSVTTTDGKTVQTYVGDIDFARDRFSIRPTGPGQDVEFRKIDDDVWVKGDAFSNGLLPKGKVWLHSEGATDGEEVSGMDPSRLLASLRASRATVTAHDEVVIDGVTTTRYDVALPTGSDQLVFPDGSGEVFVDGSGLVRRLRYTDTDSDPATINELTFSDFGKQLDIQPPPASEVAEQEDVIPNLTPGLTPSTCAPDDSASPAPTSSGSLGYSCSISRGWSVTGPEAAEQKAKFCETIRAQPVTKSFTQEQKDMLVKSVCS